MTHTFRIATYFALVIALTAPIWALGAIINIQILPGLPIAAIAVVCPSLAAAILIFRDGGRAGLFEFLHRAMHARNAHHWLLVSALINPLLFGAAFIVSRLFGHDVPAPSISAGNAVALLALFIPTAVLEEIGWSGYALAGLQQRFRPITAAILLGAFWAIWHLPVLLQADRSAAWIAYWCLWTVSARIIMAWLYTRSGANLLVVALYHAISNLCWQLYPISGSYFDPRLSGFITLAAALVLMIAQPSLLALPSNKHSAP